MSPPLSGIGRAPPVAVGAYPLDARLSDDALPGLYGQADEFLLCTARHCVKAACPALCCAAPGCSPALLRCCPRTPAFPVLAGIITSIRPTLTANLLSLAVRRQPLALLPRQTSLQRAVAAHLEQGGYIGSGYGIKKVKRISWLIFFLPAAVSLDVRLFYIFALPASAQENAQNRRANIVIYSFPVAPSAAMSSCRSVMASPLLAKHMDVNGVPPAAWGHTPAVWSTK